MTRRVYNFCAGPCTLPLEVLEEAREEFLDFDGSGMSVIEMSHRSKEYDAVHMEALRLAREVYEVPEEFSVLFIQGGATLQFAMAPMNLLQPGQRAGYVISGSWGSAACKDAAPHADVYAAWDGKAYDYMRMPAPEEIRVENDTRYLHVTSNETIGGIRISRWPDPGVPLVVDMSSDYMSRRVPWEKFDLVYGGVQKNLGPSGMALVYVRKHLLEGRAPALANYLRYDVHHEKDSLHNTPPMFAIYLMGKVLRWMKARGGIDAIEREAEHKAGRVYEVIDGSDGYYRCPVERRDRSVMNVVFRLPSEELEKQFLTQAEANDLVNLKGHRSVGGCRASLYNAMSQEGVQALVSFMQEFRRTNG